MTRIHTLFSLPVLEPQKDFLKTLIYSAVSL